MLAGRYELIRELGAGSMGVVWLAHDTVLDRAVALKELRAPEGVPVDDAVQRFLTEAQAAARLSHPSIVTVHDVFADEDRVLMSIELLDGPTLADVVAAGPLGSAARPVLSGIAEALQAAHAQGVVHRDLKPENVFLLPSGRVVVCDFGLARIGAGRGTHVGTVMGTPGYMAPEQIRGQEAGPAADIFSWGALAYELVSGQPAFGDPFEEDFMALAWRACNEDPPPLDLPEDPGLWPVIAAALAKDPAERFSSGAALTNALGGGVPAAVPSLPPHVFSSPLAPTHPAVAVSLPPLSQPPASMPPTAPAATKRSGGMVAGIVAASVVLVAVIGALGFVLLSGTSTPEIELTEARPRSAPSPADEDDPEDEPTAVPTEEEAEEEEEEEEEDALGEPSSSPSPAPPTPRTTPSPAPARQEPPPTSSGPGGPGSPPWESFVIQVASRPMGTVSWNEVQSEAASAYGYASGELDILESDDYYPAMRPGYWVIFAGPYASRSEAASALSRLSGALPSDAHVRHLDPNCVSPPCS